MLARLLGCGFVLAATAAVGAEFDPAISLGVIRTDNLTLVPVDPEEATVLRLSPQFVLTQDSPRLAANAVYRMDAYDYRERNETEVYNLFSGGMRAGIVPDRVLFDVGANRTQAAIDPESTIPGDNLAISTNRIDRDDFYAGPSFRLPAGSNVMFTGDLRRTWIRYDDTLPLGSAENYEADTGAFSVDNYRKGTGLTWAARYNLQDVDYGEQYLPYEYRVASAELGFWANQGTRLFVAAGKESAWDQPQDPSLQDSFWEVGFARDLGEQLTLEAAVGDRSYGSSQRIVLDYSFGRGETSIRYSEIPATTSFDRLSTWDPDAENQPDDPADLGPPDDYLSPAGSGERFISKRFLWTFNLDLQRTDVDISVFDEARTDRTQANGTPVGDEFQSGGNITISWQLGSRTELYLRAAVADREFASGELSDVASAAVGGQYRLGRRTALSLELEQREETSDQSVAQNYTVKMATLVLSRSF